MRIKIKLKHTFCKPQKNGDWYDLSCAEEVVMMSPIAEILKKHNDTKFRKVIFHQQLIDLGIAMQLPKGYEAIVAPRSSTFKHFGVTQTNSIGVIDNKYCGDNDWWKFSALAFRDSKIKPKDRICQFKIQLSQDATTWQKIKWMFSKRVKFIEVEHLGNPDRGGFGGTGK